MSRMMARRLGSASARRTVSVPTGLPWFWVACIRPPFFPSCAPPSDSVLRVRLAHTGLGVGDQAGEEVCPALMAHVEALELGGQALMAEVEHRSVAVVAHVEEDGGPDPVRCEWALLHRPGDTVLERGLRLHVHDDP